MASLQLTNLFDVKDKVVIITGGGRGIGKMMADGFVQNGSKVYIASRDIEACTATAEELSAKGPGQCIAVQADFITEAGCKDFADEVIKRESRVDVLINNSGMGVLGGVETPEDDWNKVLSLNVTAPFHLTNYLMPLLDVAAIAPDGARIINLGSIAGFTAQTINTVAYDTSKGAVHHMTRVLAAKLARRPNGGHILVNAIAPGLVPSIMTEGIAYVTGKSFGDMEEATPLQRMGADSDMAGLAIFLASKASGWITGTVISCDGGLIGAAETGVNP